jgi:predicted RNA binding protein YcfA (HicA-like mRNA interferase family)
LPLRPLRPREVIAKLERAGFHLARQRGSHARFLNQDGRGVTVIIQVLGILDSFAEQSDLTQDQTSEIWAWVESLPWDRDYIELHFNW